MSLLQHFPDLLLGLGLMAVTPAQAQVRAPEATAVVARARQQCAAAAPQLRIQPQLVEAARRLSRGSTLEAALDDSGYRAKRSHQWTLKGHASPEAVTQVLAQQHCGTLGDAQFTEVGVHRAGSSYWVVVAAPFDPPTLAQAEGVASRALVLVNQARAQPRRCGDKSFAAARPLSLNPLLTRAAATHAQSMAQLSYLEHQGRDGSSPADRVGRTGYNWRSVGENIAMGQTTPEQVVRDWLQSPEHCANIMEPRFTQMGLSYAVNKDSEGGIYWAQTFGLPR
jgi:uncharacterized protein YkwD